MEILILKWQISDHQNHSLVIDLFAYKIAKVLIGSQTPNNKVQTLRFVNNYHVVIIVSWICTLITIYHIIMMQLQVMHCHDAINCI